MNLLDSVVGWVAPLAGLRRLQARAALRAYEGSKGGRKTAGWHTTGGSANTENLGALPVLRNRSRDLCRNNPWAKKALGNWVDDAIGTGIQLAVDGKRRGGRAWKTWAHSTQCDADGLSDLYGLQALAARCMWESGAVIIRRRWRRESDGLVVPLQLQVLEPDYLDHHKTMEIAGGSIVGGVEFDLLGRRVAYWLYDQHPGEALRLGLRVESRRIDAADVIYAYKRRRPGEIHGVPELAAVILRLRDLDDYEDAEITRKKIEACFSVFVTSDDAGGSAVGQAVDDGKGRWLERLAPGLIKRLRPGESISFAQPAAVNGYADYMRQSLRAIASGVGQTYEHVSGDLSQVNYSSARAGMLAYRRSVEAWQWLCFVPMVCNRILHWFNDAALLAGKPTIPADTEWTPPKFEWVDPVKDMKGELLKVAAGVQSFSELQRRLGSQPDKVLAELTADWQKLRDAGIPISLDGLVALATAVDEPLPKEEAPDG